MNPRLLIYGALLTAIVISGFVVRSIARKNVSSEQGNAKQSLSGGIFAFPYMVPYYPAPDTQQPPDLQKPPLEATWNVLTNETQFVLMISDSGPFRASVWVDGWPMGEAAKSAFSYPYLTITFPDVALAPGERRVLVHFIKDTENWGWAETRLEVKSGPCRAYEERILTETARIYDLEHREGALRDGLLAFQRYLLLPCRYGMLDRDSLEKEIDAFIEILKSQESDFWETIAGKPLKRTEVRLLLKVFNRNWQSILRGISAKGRPISPFVRRDLAETASEIVAQLIKKREGKR